jgi:protein-tyrosine kinase
MMDRITKALELARQGGDFLQPAGLAPSDRDVEQEIEYTRTRTIPLSREFLREQRIVGIDAGDPLADSYRVLRTRVLQRMAQNGWKTLGITSAVAKEGKTLTAINLSVSIAREKKHTALLIDADLRRPSVHHRLGFDSDSGLSDYLMYGAPIEDILINPGIERLTILPGHTAITDSSEHLGSKRMSRLVSEVKSRYPSRLVIFDLPPVLVGDDVVAFAPLLDAVLLVVQDGKTRKDELSRAVELLNGAEILGTVLNKSDAQSQGYGYYYEKGQG